MPNEELHEDIAELKADIGQLQRTLNTAQMGLERHYSEFGSHVVIDKQTAESLVELTKATRLIWYGDETTGNPGMSKRLDRIEEEHKRWKLHLGAIWLALIGGAVKFLFDWIGAGHITK